MMKQQKLVKKPFLTLAAVVIVAAAILYIESQKPDLAPIAAVGQQDKQDEKGIADAKNTNSNDAAMEAAKSIVEDPAKASKYPKAPDFVGIENWINSVPLKMGQLRGKVVLVDFWTYTCINCIRTLPYLKEWDGKYRDKGLVIVGVHTPEFEFEKKQENVMKAVNDYQLKYPVAQDNSYATWSAYQNRYWPHKFLIDIDGYIRYDHIGEGNYDKTEKVIQELLQERMERLGKAEEVDGSTSRPEEAVSVEHYNVGTPEIYFGYQFSRGNFGNTEGLRPDQVTSYKLPFKILPNNVYLEGEWKNNADNMELAGDEGSILLIFSAKNVNIVTGSDSGSKAYVFLDNVPENSKNIGSDVAVEGNSSISNIREFKLYNIASAENYGTHVININIKGKGFKIYTFTFG